jgi:predicted Zn-ribbon and HTH transcriptional regulator
VPDGDVYKFWAGIGRWVACVRLRCRHCGYVWEYRGSSQYYATCPRCHYKVNIAKSRVE